VTGLLRQLRAHTPEEAGRLQLAVLRVFLLPVILLGELLIDHAEEHGTAFAWIFGAYGAGAIALLAWRVRSRLLRRDAPPALWRMEPFVDLLAVCALTYTSGGPFSETAMALFALPVLAAIRLRPALTARWALGSIACYVTLSLLHPTAGESEATARMAVQVLYLAWIGAGVVVVSALLAHRDAAIQRLAEERGELAAQALSAEQRERRRLADVLHDDAVQTLSVARQELVDYGRTGSPASFERAGSALAAAISQLRGQIFELHPFVLDHAGLAAALRAVAEQCAGRLGAEITVTVDTDATGAHDELLLVLARELLTNAAKHSGATRVAVSVAADAEQLELEVRDDGAGFDAGRRFEALGHGHIGLASAEQRLGALGGRLEVRSAPGKGTAVRAVLPAVAPAAAPVP
jgi:two-component system, NarL family, sensor kinase